MDAGTPSKRPRTTPAASVTAGTPRKPKNAPAGALFPEQAATPDKTERRPLLRRAAGKGAVALSVKEVRLAALELRRADKGPVAVGSKEEDALESDAAPSSAGPRSSRRKGMLSCLDRKKST
jgi:chromatin licensing and DNA replication factor 1